MTRVWFMIALTLQWASPVMGAKKDELIVYTYDSFISEWGPGPTLKKAFETECDCQIKWVPVADGAALLARLKIEGSATKADVVVGIDDSLTGSAEKSGLFMDTGIKIENLDLPSGYTPSTTFIPIDFGYYAFMFDTKARQKSGQPYPRPSSMRELLSSPAFDRSVIIQDPRTSAPGMAMLLWFRALYGDDMNRQLTNLKGKVLTVSRGWSDAYALFTKGEAPIVFSYSTSEAYHREVEKTDRYQSLTFSEGHYVVIETAAILKSSAKKPLATRFTRFLTKSSSQSTIASMNWMYPVISSAIGLPPSLTNLSRPRATQGIPPAAVDKNRIEWTQAWTRIFSR